MRELTHPDDRHPRVLLSAYACEPAKGSEPGVGWNWARQISQFAEVWVLTRANNRGLIEAALAAQPLPHVHFIYYDLPRWTSFWKRGSRGVHAYYYLWQLGAYFAARNSHRDNSFDLIHHATFATCWFPSFLAFLPAPFVWGPLGGGESTPRSFSQSFSARGKVYEFFRSLGSWRGRLDPFVRAAARRAAFALATTPETEKQLRALGCAHTGVLSLAAIGDEEFELLARIPERTSGSFRVFSIGRLLHWKGFHLGIAGFARFHREHPESEYWIIGDGPERRRLEKLARELSIAEHVHFYGELPRAETLEKIAACDVMVQPSLHDSSGWASIEAMAAGRAVICLDAGGLALQVDEGNGVKIPAVSPSQAVDAIASALENMARNPELCLQYGRAGRARVAAEFNWARKTQEIRRIYDRLLARNPLIAPHAGEPLRHANEAEVPVYRADTL